MGKGGISLRFMPNSELLYKRGSNANSGHTFIMDLPRYFGYLLRHLRMTHLTSEVSI